MTVELFGHIFEHISAYRAIGNPVYAYAVRTEDGYYIRTARLEENVYKTSTSIYATDDFDSIIIIPESELPEEAILMGGNKPETEVM